MTNTMPGILIIAHAPLASSLKSVALHTYPDRAGRVEALDVDPEMPADDIDRLGRALLERVRNPQALIFTDVFGASPSNAAQRLVDGVHVKAIAGVNVPMLWRTLCYCDESLDAMVARAVAGATQGVMQLGTSRPQNQTFKPGGHDPSHHYHQQ